MLGPEVVETSLLEPCILLLYAKSIHNNESHFPFLNKILKAHPSFQISLAGASYSPCDRRDRPTSALPTNRTTVQRLLPFLEIGGLRGGGVPCWKLGALSSSRGMSTVPILPQRRSVQWLRRYSVVALWRLGRTTKLRGGTDAGESLGASPGNADRASTWLPSGPCPTPAYRECVSRDPEVHVPQRSAQGLW